MKEYPIVKIKTEDDLLLFGYLAESNKKETILINIHGTASSFYEMEFEEFYVHELPEVGISVLFTNNRGHNILDTWQKTGAAIEHFEDCLKDINAWIEFALKKGYKKIILQGHSLGTEKIIYYMNKGKYKNKIKAIILLSFADSYGTQEKYLKKIKINLMNEAKDLIKKGKKEQFLTKSWYSHAGILPKSAASYVNFFKKNSELSKTLPLRQGNNLKYYKKINVPILGIIGDKKEYTVILINQAINLLKKENKNSEICKIKNCDHNFTNKQKELLKIVKNFLIKIK
jgi:pimeloyl-ACP methyl ester carboxylesterase